MSFFESIPQPPPPAPPAPERRPAWVRPDTVIPGAVPAEVMLIRTGEVAVAVGSVRAYPNGFEFTVHVRGRHADDAIGYRDPFERHRHLRGEQTPHEALRLGVMYANGRRTATTARQALTLHDPGPETLVLQQGGGGGGARSWDMDFWVYPLPPEGPVTLVASWLEHGVTETRAELDGTAIRQAAGRAVILWPDEPGPESGGAWRSERITHFTSGSAPSPSPGPGQPGGADAAQP
jgi:hypothetical protein